MSILYIAIEKDFERRWRIIIQLTHVSVSAPSGTVFSRILGALLPDKFQKERMPILKDITLWLGKGETFAVLGEQGAGKTTLLRPSRDRIR